MTKDEMSGIVAKVCEEINRPDLITRVKVKENRRMRHALSFQAGLVRLEFHPLGVFDEGIGKWLSEQLAKVPAAATNEDIAAMVRRACERINRPELFDRITIKRNGRLTRRAWQFAPRKMLLEHSVNCSVDQTSEDRLAAVFSEVPVQESRGGEGTS